MIRLTSRTIVPLLLTLATGAAAQEQELPPGATSKVIDVLFRVEDFGAKAADLEVRETDTELRIELAADVLFDFDKATLLPRAEETLTKTAAFIQDRKAASARIEGHTDSKGNDAYNQRLSERRAEAVRQWFVHHGLGGLQYSVVGFGETRPVAPNNKPDGTDDPDGRTKNRRVEIVIAKKR